MWDLYQGNQAQELKEPQEKKRPLWRKVFNSCLVDFKVCYCLLLGAIDGAGRTDWMTNWAHWLRAESQTENESVGVLDQLVGQAGRQIDRQIKVKRLKKYGKWAARWGLWLLRCCSNGKHCGFCCQYIWVLTELGGREVAGGVKCWQYEHINTWDSLSSLWRVCSTL